MISVLFTIALLYALILGWLALGSSNLESTKHAKPETTRKFSILVPFRNEAEHLPLLLGDLHDIVYPKDCIEIILIDDDSTDGSLEQIDRFYAQHPEFHPAVLIEAKTHGRTGKKEALSLGIAEASHPWIVTTDADTIIPYGWLHLLNLRLEKGNVEMVCGPVGYVGGGSWLERFQQLDNLALQTISRGLFGRNKPLLANGANFCYSKALFQRLQGFEGNEQHPSGDDQFLLEKARSEDPAIIGYLNVADATVYTYPVKKFKDLVSQRVRWAGKTRHQRSSLLRFLAVLVGLTNLAVLLIFVLLILFPENWEALLLVPALKWITDAWLIFNAASYFKTRPKFFDFVTACLFYPIFGTWVFLAGLGGGYSWKDRDLAH